MNAPPQFSPKADIPTLLLVAQVVAPVPARPGSGPSQSGALPSAHGLRRVGLSCDADARELRVGTAPLQQPRRRTNGGENGAAGGTGRAGGNASGDDDDERDPIVIAPEERPFLIIATDGLWEVIEPQEAVSQLW